MTSLTVLLFSSSCAKRVSSKIRPEHIGTKYARLTGYFATRSAAPGGARTESTPGDIRRDVLRDEATLLRTSPNETCFGLVVKTHREYDEPFDQLEPECSFKGGDDLRAVVENETVSVFEYAYTGERTLVSAEGISATAYAGLSITQAEERSFRVIERRGEVCCPSGEASTISLDLTNPNWDYAGYNYHLIFDWTIE